MPEFSIKIKDLAEFQKNFKKSPALGKKELSRAIKESVHIIRPLMVRNAPIDGGALRRNIYARASGLRGEVGPDMTTTPYAIYVHEGTRPHIIRAKNKKVLANKAGQIFGTIVHHPGTKPNPFVERTTKEASQPINKIFGNALKRFINQLVK